MCIRDSSNTHFNDKTGSLGNDPFSANDTDKEVRVAHTAHGFRVGDKVTFSGASSLVGVDMNDTFTVKEILNANVYVVDAKTQASATSMLGGGSVTYNANSFNSLGTLASTTEVTVNAATGLNISYGELASQESVSYTHLTLPTTPYV